MSALRGFMYLLEPMELKTDVMMMDSSCGFQFPSLLRKQCWFMDETQRFISNTKLHSQRIVEQNTLAFLQCLHHKVRYATFQENDWTTYIFLSSMQTLQS